jgi:AcrR family transcriptional regulator
LKRSRNASSEILTAAREVTAREGAGKLTIESVARQIGMSKGGVLYNFPSKQALLSALLRDMIDEHLVNMRDVDQDRPHPTLRGHLHSLAACSDLKENLSMAILAAAAESPEFLDPLRTVIEGDQSKITSETTDPIGAHIILAALDGLRFQNLLGMPPYDNDTREKMQHRLESMINELR